MRLLKDSGKLDGQYFPVSMNERKHRMPISHPYIKISRNIKNNIQHCREFEEELVLSGKKITTASDHFHLDEILDMSYKPFSGNSGFLYLHTNRGLYSFHTRMHPHKFMQAYRQSKAENSK
ncbi:hypothetical protein [Bacillus sp. FJAT-27251]|uniref:hypothetical protein n=1 Tax=Bacillus sp. FJAT-27251 TaxID=1684142 RepID=UPI0006A7A638|nr:hypothetical protein [Bacillus sp. FJAT-27251]